MIAWGYGLFWRLAAFTGMMRLDAAVLDTLRDEPGLIVVANHPSMLDAVMLMARLPRSACIMKASLMHNPLLGPGARLARYIRNDSAYGMIQCAVQDLRAGGQLVMFPEGTRTTRAPLNPFHASFTLIAKRAGVPIQAVFIDTDSPYLGKGWPLWRLPPLPILFSVRLGRRFDAASSRPCGPDGPDRSLLRGRCARARRPAMNLHRRPRTHLVLIPSYNTGPQGVRNRGRGACAWTPVWVVVDGSTDGTAEGLQRMAVSDPGCRCACCRPTSARAPPCCTACSRRRRPASATR
jgi:1-acyl-sn-glycerol-3-phosphate acyltransferase